jgi:hypothetical protein
MLLSTVGQIVNRTDVDCTKIGHQLFLLMEIMMGLRVKKTILEK